MANGDNIDPKKLEEINARKKEGINLDQQEFEALQNKSRALEEIMQKYTGHNQLLQQNAANQTDITSQLKFQLKEAKENKEEIRESLNISKQAANAIKNSIGPHSTIRDIEKQRGKNLQIQEQLKQKILALGIGEAGGIKELQGEIQKRINFDKKSLELQEEFINHQQAELDALSNFRTAKQLGNAEDTAAAKLKLENLNKVGKNLSNEIDLHSKNAAEASKIETSQLKQAQALLDTNQNLDDANEKLDENLRKREAINNALGLSGGLLKGINSVLGGALGSTNNILSNAEKRVEAINEQNSYYDEQGNLIENNVGKLRGFGIILNEIGKSILDNITDPLVIVGSILDFSAQTTKFSKELGISKDKANELMKEFTALSGEINNGLDGNIVNSQRLMETISGINKEMGGFAFAFQSKELGNMAAEATIFREAMGGTEAEAMGIMQSALNTGKSFREMQKEIVSVSNEISKQTGLQFNTTALMKEAAGVTGQVRAQLGGSVTEISKVLAVTKSFGMELNQVKNIASGLLDFESSINAELEAELLTGKQLNLEQARLFALTGDYKGLTEEINKNVGDFNDFSKMNVLQQESIAKALGMSADEMSDMLFKQGSLAEMKAKAKADNDTETLQMLEQRDIQQQMADIIFQLKQNFINAIGGAKGLEEIMKKIGDVAGKITNFLSSDIGQIVIKLTVFGKILGSILPIFKTMSFLTGLIKINTSATALAEKIGLVSKRQSVMIKTREQMLNKTAIADTSAKNLYENMTLGTTIKRNAAKNIGIAREKVSLGLSKAKALVEKLINSTIIKQGLSMVKNVAKGALNLGMSIARGAATIFRAAMSTFGAIPLVGIGLATAAAVAGIATMKAMSKPKKAMGGSIMGPGHSQGGVDIEVEGGEFIVNKAAASKIGTSNLETINKGALPAAMTTQTKQDNSDLIAAINALGDKPGMKETKVDTVPAPTDLFANNTKIGKGSFQQQYQGRVLFT